MPAYVMRSHSPNQWWWGIGLGYIMQWLVWVAYGVMCTRVGCGRAVVMGSGLPGAGLARAGLAGARAGLPDHFPTGPMSDD